MTLGTSDPTGSLLTDRLGAALARIDAAAASAGRESDEVLVLLATKTRTAEEVAAALRELSATGRRIAVGENRAQEIAKHAEPPLAALEDELGVPRHFIGRLQRNKARDVVDFARLIHSVDREEIATALARRAELAGVEREVLLQVNTSGEESKGGFAPTAEAVGAAIELVDSLPGLHPAGLMTIGANTSAEAAVRDSLSRLRGLREELADPRLVELSMGMSGDLEIAVQEGATIVRLGSAVFGPRPA